MSNIEIISKIVPKNGRDFPVVEDSYVQGGFRSLEAESDRNAIPVSSRKTGMIVYVRDDQKYYKLSSPSNDLGNNSGWEEVVINGGSSSLFIYNYSGNISPLSDDILYSSIPFFSDENKTYSLEVTVVISSPFNLDYSGHFFFKILCKNSGGNLVIDSIHEVFSYNPSRYFSISFSPSTSSPEALDISVTNVGPMPVVAKASFYATTIINNSTLLGIGNRALNFDGVDDYVDIPLNTLPSGNYDHSLEFWIKYDGSQYGTSDVCIGWYGDVTTTDGAEIISFNGASGILNISHANRGITSCLLAAITTDNSWTHVAIVYDATAQTNDVFINGSIVETLYYANPLNISPNTMQLGSLFDGLNQVNFMKATLDEYRFWNKKIIAYDINLYMNERIDPTSSNLIAYYDFEQGIANGNNSGTANDLLDKNEDGIVNELLDKQSFVGPNDGTLMGFALNGTSSNWVSRD